MTHTSHKLLYRYENIESILIIMIINNIYLPALSMDKRCKSNYDNLLLFKWLYCMRV